MSSEFETIKVTRSEMPVSCPPKGTESLDLHPRVYIKMGKNERSKCPYCGNQFEWAEENG